MYVYNSYGVSEDSFYNNFINMHSLINKLVNRYDIVLCPALKAIPVLILKHPLLATK